MLTGNEILLTLRSMSRAGVSYEKLQYTYDILKNGNKDLTPELKEKINQLLLNVDKGERNLSSEVREYVMNSTGIFMSPDVVKSLQLSTRNDLKNLSNILKRLCEEELIEKYGNKNGCFRRVIKEYTEQRWWEAKGKPLHVFFPLDIHLYAKIYSGNTILLEGQKSQGKSAFALEFSRLNMNLFPKQVTYQNVEMSDDEIIERINSYPKDIITPDVWQEKVRFIRRTSDWWDLIDPDSVNVVDYLIEYKEAYLIADFVFRIHQRLKKGICLVVVQRDPFKPYGQGGRSIRDIPRLIISLKGHIAKLEDVKSFWSNEGVGNPTGLMRDYKQVSWWKLLPQGNWYLEKI